MRAKRATNAGEGKMMTNVGHSEQCEESHKLSCKCRHSVRNTKSQSLSKENPSLPSLEKGRSTDDGFAIAEQVSNDEGNNDGKEFSSFTPHTSHKHVAFTLAEVLITLGIIGVVAAMTIPNVVNNNTEKKKIVKLKKVYSQLSSVYDLAVSEKQLVSIKEYLAKYPGQYDADSHIAFRDFFTPYFKATKKGEYGKGYMARWIENPQKTSTTTARDCNSFSTFVANDGTAYIFRLLPFNCTSMWGSYADRSSLNTCGEIFVDLYPTSKSLRVNWNDMAERVVGKDVFMFHVTADGIVPAGISSANSDTLECYTNGYACTHWVLMNENMDYLHCDGLSGNGKRKCE